MKPLKIEEGQSTPKVIFDKDNNRFEITGYSLPENVIEFYSPVYNWMKEYITQPNKKTELHINLVYFNSASSKVILDILFLLEDVIYNGFEAEVFWYYLEMDEDMYDAGKEYESLLKMPFNLISYVQK